MVEKDRDINLYLEYLAEASRRIIRSYHFELIFKPKHYRRKRKKCNLVGFYAEKNKLKEYLNSKMFLDCYELQSQYNKDILLCSGLLIVNITRKFYAGPIVYSKIKRDYEAEEYYLSDINVNYDILSILTDIDIVDESEEASLEIQKLSRIINEIEDFLEGLIGEDDYIDLEKGLDIIGQVEEFTLNKVKDLMELNPVLVGNEIEVIENSEYNYEEEVEKYKYQDSQISIFNKKGIIYIKSYHTVYLENPVFSAYASLKKLLKSSNISKSDSNFSVFLKTLIGNTEKENISNKDKYFELFSIKDFNFEDIINIFPLSLSYNQKIGIENAFTEVISYIQGPPGTGKSHTITAIAILALLTGRKVLIVSAKVPAIEVIKSKLEQIFNFERDLGFLPYVFFHKNYRRMFISYIDKLLNQTTKILIDECSRLQNQKNLLINNIKNKLKELKRLERQRKDYHNTLHEFNSVSENIISICKRYYDMYNFNLKHGLKVNNTIKENTLRPLKFRLNIYKKLSYSPNTKLFNIYEHKITKTYTTVFPFIKDLVPKVDRVSLFNDVTELFFNELKANKLNNKIRKIPIEDIDKRIISIKRELQEYIKELIKITVQQRIYNAIINERNIFENFKQLLRSKKHSRIKKYQDIHKIKKFLDVFPLFISEIRNIGEVLPLEEEIFDLVVVDESSQVNLAEIIPVFYRGKKLCVVGDDKQLSLEAVGLNFNLSRKLDTFMWEKYKPGSLSYNEAKEKKLTVATASILDLLIENKLINSHIMLNEHFRSLPKLIEFNNKEFYENQLVIMTETPDKKDVDCFLEIKVTGQRDKEKVIQEEVDKVIEVIQKLRNGAIKINNPFLKNKTDLSVGIVSVISKGVIRIKEALEEENLLYEEYNSIKVGTPEDLQGHEFDIVIFPLFLDENVKNVNHYENERRFNVATSRARYLTILIRNKKLPRTVKRIERYINHFDKAIEYTKERFTCKFDPQVCESQLELYVYKFLEDYVKKVQENKNMKIIICNQYKFGSYRLDFVLFNKTNGKYLAIEVDGKHHFEGKDYADWHKERIAFLKRAGWNIVNTPYYKWFYYGWLEDSNPVLKAEVEKIYKLCDKYLL